MYAAKQFFLVSQHLPFPSPQTILRCKLESYLSVNTSQRPYSITLEKNIEPCSPARVLAFSPGGMRLLCLM